MVAIQAAEPAAQRSLPPYNTATSDADSIRAYQWTQSAAADGTAASECSSVQQLTGALATLHEQHAHKCQEVTMLQAQVQRLSNFLDGSTEQVRKLFLHPVLRTWPWVAVSILCLGRLPMTSPDTPCWCGALLCQATRHSVVCTLML